MVEWLPALASHPFVPRGDWGRGPLAGGGEAIGSADFRQGHLKCLRQLVGLLRGAATIWRPDHLRGTKKSQPTDHIKEATPDSDHDPI